MTNTSFNCKAVVVTEVIEKLNSKRSGRKFDSNKKLGLENYEWIGKPI